MFTRTLLNVAEQDVSDILSRSSHFMQSGMPLWQKVEEAKIRFLCGQVLPSLILFFDSTNLR